ncbi:hypothetical protein SODALDRAFT_323434 [Sodiomyces alkalinus F11]|uniref:F-box domain-containing protein n=1 Tax=Sodiomyces alkalinus (strain CBS 110278 / VKM F-3762 / F11) TaxID=1314773 RepID=A0A3N2PWN9_SODAK|nr:hypothetical protein SODALDRAFT_323434 [Sodiomyces alkalinus F11]ROT38940.1 hypothetical protein SODALDRAFT_323434 [Sodiomyces alkalinus F11]
MEASDSAESQHQEDTEKPPPGHDHHHDRDEKHHDEKSSPIPRATEKTADSTTAVKAAVDVPSTKKSAAATSNNTTTIAPLAPLAFPYRHHRSNQYASLLYLPMELQFLICSHLSFGDLQTLRRTNRFYRHLINLDFVRICLGSIATDNELRFVCRTCMRYDESRRRLVWPLSQRAQPPPADGNSSDDEDVNSNDNDGQEGEQEQEQGGRRNGQGGITNRPASLGYCPDPSVPLAGHCADCAVRLRQLSPGEYVLTDAGERKVRVCRWCGWPCHVDHAQEEYWPRSAWELHPKCAETYQLVLIGHYTVVCLRSGIAFVTYILLWRLFGQNTLVVVPSILAFLLMGVILCIVWVRGREVRTYHVVGGLEFSILALGIPPMYVVVPKVNDPGVIAAEIMLVIHLIVRLLNVLGNVVLFLEYDVTKHHAPDVPYFRRLLLNPLIAGLVFWTSPRALENLWIGRGKHPRHKSFRRGMTNSFKHIGKSFNDFWSVRATTDIQP